MGQRFNLILEDRQYAALAAESARSSVAMAELMRRAIDAALGLEGERTTPGFEVSFGLWRRPDAAVIGRRAGVRLQR
ncbi:MAG TPA: hypothetical protein VFA05_00850 [Gaiellaceae bacterium]|nr:hypothetical protein [Gaiellaceae bacterium]